MNRQSLESLLREGEGIWLDFERDRYAFAKAPDAQKSELLKDLLGFANADRRADSYILIRIEDGQGRCGRVVGVAEHLHDYSLQQFVNSKTNRTLRFQYEPFNATDTTSV